MYFKSIHIYITIFLLFPFFTHTTYLSNSYGLKDMQDTSAHYATILRLRHNEALPFEIKQTSFWLVKDFENIQIVAQEILNGKLRTRGKYGKPMILNPSVLNRKYQEAIQRCNDFLPILTFELNKLT